MTKQQFYHTAGTLCILMVLLMQTTNCSKDYSYEGDSLTDTASHPDTNAYIPETINVPSLQLAACPSCNISNDLIPDTWRFTVNGTIVCGKVTNAVKNAAGTAVTFFGPSACSQDTGLVMTAYFLSPGLSVNAVNQVAQRVGFEYYDNITPSPIVDAQFTSFFTLVIERYTQQTEEATGNFAGQARTSNGAVVSITSGKFRITFK